MNNDEIKKQIEQLQQELSKREQLEKLVPNLRVYTNRWKRQFYVSSYVNDKATDVFLKHGCGCCADSPLLACPYMVVDGENIYSDPIEICIGEKIPGTYRDRGDEEWRERLKSYNISDEAIEKIAVLYNED